MEAITVKAGTVPGTLTTIALEEGATVADALRQANLDASGYQVRVNGETADTSRTLGEGDTVLLTRQIKGNMPTVKAGTVPGVLRDVAIEDGASVADVLAAAGLSSEGYQVRLNGEAITNPAGEEIEEGDTILLSRQIKGNR